MQNLQIVPQALTIAGSDSGGGAGIQADLKTMQERDVFGCSVIVAVTAQNTLGVQSFEKMSDAIIRAQLDSVFSDFDIRALKTGMLPDAATMHIVASYLRERPEIQVVVDPVMIAKGGASLMEDEAVATMRDVMVPLATVLTPNLPEAEVLCGMTIQNEADMITAAQQLIARGAKHVVVKGGHRLGTDAAEDVLVNADGTVERFSLPRIDTPRTHGTGCTFSACITAELAKGRSVAEAVRTAKTFIHAAITDGIAVGHGHGPTNHWAYRKAGKEGSV